MLGGDIETKLNVKKPRYKRIPKASLLRMEYLLRRSLKTEYEGIPATPIETIANSKFIFAKSEASNNMYK